MSHRSPESSLAILKTGNHRFVTQTSIHHLTPPQTRQDALTRHKPIAAILSCGDARVSTEIIFDQGIGSLFTLRNAGNVATTNVIGGLEFVVSDLGTPLVLVVGHTQCAVIGAATGVKPHSPYIAETIEHVSGVISDVRAESDDELWRLAGITNARAQRDQLLAHSEVLRTKAADGTIQVLAAFYDLASGVIEFLD